MKALILSFHYSKNLPKIKDSRYYTGEKGILSYLLKNC